jgi:cytochrome c biogenesis protein
VSAERGYLRETGNLVFHTALIGVLVAVGIGGGFGYTGQKVVVEGYSLTNSLASYDSFNPGRFFTDETLEPYSIALDSFVPKYDEDLTSKSLGQALDYTANVTATEGGGTPHKETVKVNAPLAIGGTQVYLLGNGYAPVVTVRDPQGTVVFSQPTACLPQDVNLTSNCVIKIPDGLSEQLGMLGFFYPTAAPLSDGTLTSTYPDTLDPVLSLFLYTGDLGLDNGKGTNAYVLNPDSLTQIAGMKAPTPALKLGLGDTLDLPNGLGTIELTAVPRFASFDVHHDPAQAWVLLFAILAVGGLITSLFIPRRRVWVKAVVGDDGVMTLEYAGLARGDDPGLATAVAEIAEKHTDQLGLKVEP